MINLIRQQHLHVEVTGSDSDGLALQSRLAALCRDWLNPALDRVLARFAPQDGHLCIERLTIDAGAMPLEQLEHVLPHKAAQVLEKALTEHLTQGIPAPSDRTGTIQHKTTHVATAEAFIYFLQTGSLPWSFRLPEKHTLERVVLKSWRRATQIGTPLLPNVDEMLRVLSDPGSRKRLVRQFSPELPATLLALLSPKSIPVLEQSLSAIRRADLPSDTSKDLAHLLWETVFAAVALRQAVSIESLVRQAWESTEASYPLLVKVLLRHHSEKSISQTPADTNISGMPERVFPASEADGSSGSRAAPRFDAAQPSVSDELAAKPSFQITSAPDSSGPTNAESGRSTGSEHPDAREGIYIDNAGLVLLHPFLPQFFQALNLAENDRILQPERALVLLHFLATGQTKAPEYELGLPKILCGIPLCSPVDTNLEPTDGEMEEADTLLKAVVRHWEVLRNTSADALRGTFLIRPGKLSQPEEGDWLLQVESRSFDILLDHLPWGISMIKLPWMERILSVQWK